MVIKIPKALNIKLHLHIIFYDFAAEKINRNAVKNDCSKINLNTNCLKREKSFKKNICIHTYCNLESENSS